MTLFPRVTNTKDEMKKAKAEAHRLLDMAMAGLDVSDESIAWALITTGDKGGEHEQA